MDEFQKRNEKRVKEQGYADANTWAKEVFSFHDEMKDFGMIDKSIDASQQIEVIAEEVLEFLENQ